MMCMRMNGGGLEVGSRRGTWATVLNAILQALIAALTALGVSSCVQNISL